MSSQELDRLSVLGRVAERRLSQREAARVLGVTERQLRRLWWAYRRDGAAGLVSGKRGRRSNNRLPEAVKDRVIDVVRQRYRTVSRFRIDHPSTEDVYAVAGVDHALGFFAEVFGEDRIAPIASVDIFTLGRPATTNDCVELLMEFAFFTEAELHAALVFLQDGSPSKAADFRVVNVVMAFKQAAD